MRWAARAYHGAALKKGLCAGRIDIAQNRTSSTAGVVKPQRRKRKTEPRTVRRLTAGMGATRFAGDQAGSLSRRNHETLVLLPIRDST